MWAVKSRAIPECRAAKTSGNFSFEHDSEPLCVAVEGRLVIQAPRVRQACGGVKPRRCLAQVAFALVAFATPVLASALTQAPWGHKSSLRTGFEPDTLKAGDLDLLLQIQALHLLWEAWDDVLGCNSGKNWSFPKLWRRQWTRLGYGH